MTISILIPNYNHGRFLRRALNALINQTVPPDEILIIDDCSTDDSISIIESFKNSLPQMRLLRNPINLGVNQTINLSIKHAKGDYIVCSAGDDWLEAHFLEEMTYALQKFSDARLIVSGYVEFFEAKNEIVVHNRLSERGCWYVDEEISFISPEALLKFLKRGFVWLPMNCAVIHRLSILDIGGLDPDLRWHADWFVNFTMAVRHGFAVVPKPLTVFRVAENTYSIAGMRNLNNELDVCKAIYKKLKSPEFIDVYHIIRRRPAALTPFVRYFVKNLLPELREWPFLISVLWWWLNEACRGRRPRRIREFMKSRGLLTPPY